MNGIPKTYDDWLVLSAEEQHRVHSEVWDTYSQDGIAFAFNAASRLALASPRRILNIEIGTYHGGEYLLHMVVSPDDFKDCPPMLEDTFEGFRVVWIPSSHPQPFDQTDATLEGSWVSEDGLYEFDFEAHEAGLGVYGRIGGSDSTLLVEQSALNGQFLLFTAIDPKTGIYSRHSFRLVGPDLAEDDLTSVCKFRRKNQKANKPALTTPDPL